MNNSIYLQLISLNKKHTKHYLKRYVKLVSFYKERNWSYKSGLHHEHHIVPESFGGLDTVENLVVITIREHFILHWMLYKAFPRSQMTTAFHMMCHCSGQKISSKVYEKLMLEFIERQRETTGQRTRKLVAEGKHPWQGDGEFQRELANKRVEEGKHPWQGDGELQRKMNLKRVEEGTNPFSGPEGNNKRLENGTHPSQIKKVCPHCNRKFSLGMFVKYHGDKCKLNPLNIKESKPKPKTIWVCNSSSRKLIQKDLLEEYISNGFILGMKFKVI
jgi:hypothetical protein